MPELGIDVRCGRHTGECEIRGDDIGGIAVHIGARVAALAQAGEVLVSSTVKDLVNGSGIAFTERGSHMLKGVPGQWQLFAPAGQVAAVDYHVPVKRRGFKRSWQIGLAADRESPARCCGCPTGAKLQDNQALAVPLLELTKVVDPE